MIVQSRASVVPLFFYGQNSWLFQAVSHFSMTLRLSLLLKEAHDRIGSRINVLIGKRLPYEDLAAYRDRKQLMAFLRDRSYAIPEQFGRCDS
jgi:hypothetical protein